MSLAVRLQVETVRSITAAAIAAAGIAYSGIGTAMIHPIRMFLLQNLTDATLMFSFDGINGHFPLPRNGYIVLDITTNKTQSTGFFLAEGQRLYVTGIEVPTAGAVYFTVFYGADI